MASYKVCLLLSVLCVLTRADFDFARFNAFQRRGNDYFRPLSYRHDDSYEFASSDFVPRYANSRGHRGYPDTVRNWQQPEDFYHAASTTNIPNKNCVEVKKDGDGGKGTSTCYKCKDPKTGSTYEQCSYVSQPSSKSATTRVENFVVPPAGFRYRRSNSKEDELSAPRNSNYRDTKDHEKRESPYRFDDDVFDHVGSGVSSKYKNKDEKCEKKVDGDMVCMVCEDEKTNGKYEQCSYVRNPGEKAYSYSKSSSFNNPQTERHLDNDDKNNREYSESKPVKEYTYPGDKYHDKRNQEQRTREESDRGETSENCKKVQKDSKSCMVCTDPKTGGNYEKCSYAYQPNDKVYKFSRSKSFGYPETSSSQESKSQEKPSEASSHSDDSSEYQRDYSIPEGFYSNHGPRESSSFYGDDKSTPGYRRSSDDSGKKKQEDGPSEYAKSESERVSEQVDSNNCKEVKKDSMVCKVCKDPKTGSNFEQCSYSYKPSDKMYSYTKSRSFGSPTQADGDSPYGSESKEEGPRYESGNYRYSSHSKPYEAASDTQTEVRELPDAKNKKVEKKEESSDKGRTETPKKVDVHFYDTMKKKEEIEKFLQEFQELDKSNCKKIMRDKMTCYQCKDEKGVQKEECAFVTAPESEKDKLAYREIKEFQTEPTKKVPRSTIVKLDDGTQDFPLEPEGSASEKFLVKRERPTEEVTEKKTEEEETKEAEPYDYAEETKPVYDKVLGLTLPAYMLETSEHEEEFDEVVASSRI